MSEQLQCSVVICSFNPDRERLERTLDGLKRQTLPIRNWEFILVDNASEKPLEKAYDLSWHASGRHEREPQQGITHARIRGMNEAKADVILFVDDDNILEPNYLERGLELGSKWPHIGCWGGQLLPEFEIDPPDWTRPFWNFLAIRPLRHDLWTNLIGQHEAVPPTAGMFVRRTVWEPYVTNAMKDSRHYLVGQQEAMLPASGLFEKKTVWETYVRKAMKDSRKILNRGEDTDLAFTACDLGFGVARFRELILTHIIPAERLSEPYLLKLVEGIAYSTIVVEGLRNRYPRFGWPEELIQLLEWMRSLRLPRRKSIFYQAELRGRRAGRRVVRKFATESN